MKRTTIILAGCLIFMISQEARAQRVPDPKKGDPNLTQWGVMNGNRVRSLYANHGEIARWPDQPSGEWPKGSGRSYVDGVAFIVAAIAPDINGNPIKVLSTNYREFIDRDPVTKVPWGWAPVPGYSNRRQDLPARSDDPGTWPESWPDRPIDWAGQWNGFFGKGVLNADVETYFVFDDSPDQEWTGPPHFFLPCPGDDERGGLGLEVATRGFQWNHPLAQDVIFWLYEITNECSVDYDDMYMVQYIDWGVGGTADSGDDEGAFNVKLDMAFAWDFDGVGSPGRWGPVGTVGYAFLESPGNFTDGIDNDSDGIIDERRESGPGQLIEGQDAIRDYVTANYNLDLFEEFYRDLEFRPAFQDERWWTGDEELDWLGFQDLNDNGIWEENEPLRDDVGEDGLGPNASNYTGRDLGEGDGIPTAGEPNFDALDKDESDQIGLTGFSIFNVHDYELTDDAGNYDLYAKALPPIDDIVLGGGRNLGMFFSSGPFPLKAGQTERFSMALIFAEKDFTDPTEISNSSLARKKETVQQIYNADYRFARPPDKPELTATPGDGQVTLIWDDSSERSFDPFLREFDFEGYMIYRSTEPNFEENLKVTDSFGNTIFQKPIAQFDLDNGLRGPHPVAINGVQFNLGTDSGLRHSFIDTDVINGRTYFYAIVAYDRGFLLRDEDGQVLTDLDGQVRGLSPSLTTAVINNDIAGNIVADINTAIITPRAPSAGYISPEVGDFQLDVRGTGTVSLNIVSPAKVNSRATYELTFTNESLWQNESEVGYSLTNTTTGTLLEEGTIPSGFKEIPPLEGFLTEINNATSVQIVVSSIRMEGEAGTFSPIVLPGTAEPSTSFRFVAIPADFTIHFTEAVADTSMRLSFGTTEIETKFYIENRTTGEKYPFIIFEDIPELRNGEYDHGELIVLVSGVEPGLEPELSRGKWRTNWIIRLIPPDPQLDPDIPVIPPAPESSLSFDTTKPFQTGDKVTFTIEPPSVSKEKAIDDLDDIFVVPNPYVATSTFEPSNVFRSGRGERRIVFMNLPARCTIRIYTITGQLVNTLHHDSVIEDGQLSWDLVTKDGMNISYGIFIYHVDAPEIGEHIGRFAVIK